MSRYSIIILLFLLAVLVGCSSPSVPQIEPNPPVVNPPPIVAPAPEPKPEPTPEQTTKPIPAPTPTQILAPTTTPTPLPTPSPTPMPSPPVGPNNELFIDAHSQLTPENLDRVISLMDKGGISRTILSAGVTSKRGILSPKELVSLANKYPGRIIPAVRTKGGAYVRNEKSYYNLLNMQMATEQYGAMAEVLVYHAQKSGHSRQAPEIVVYPDDKRVQAALNYSLEKQWPFVIHIEFAAAGTQYDEFMTKLEEILLLYPEHPFVLIHMGQLTHIAVSQLIEKYPNIYFITSHSNPVTVRRYGQPWTNLFKGNNLSADWEWSAPLKGVQL